MHKKNQNQAFGMVFALCMDAPFRKVHKTCGTHKFGSSLGRGAEILAVFEARSMRCVAALPPFPTIKLSSRSSAPKRAPRLIMINDMRNAAKHHYNTFKLKSILTNCVAKFSL